MNGIPQYIPNDPRFTRESGDFASYYPLVTGSSFPQPVGQCTIPSMNADPVQNEYHIEKILPGGVGLSRDDNGVVLVSGAAPGDLVRLGPIRKKKGARRAEVAQIITASPDRTEPLCEHYGICGGCDFQHIRYEQQLSIKEEILRDALVRQGGFDSGDPLITDLMVVPSEAWNSRNRLQFHMTASGPGFMRAGSDEIVPIQRCPVSEKAVQEFLDGGWKSLPVHLKEEGVRLPLFSPGPYGLTPQAGRTIAGKGEIELFIAGVKLRFDVRGFFQSNLIGLEKLLEYFLTQIPLRGAKAVDIYCGAGLFAAVLPESYSEVHAVERNPKSLEYARKNIGARGRCHSLSVEKWIAARKTPNFNDIDLVIVDPPRSGLDSPLKDLLVRHRPGSLVYVSCDPVTLARDLATLKAAYRVTAIRGFDLSPQNHHVESLVTLEPLR